MGKFKVDWGVNVSQLIAFSVMLLGAITANERRLSRFEFKDVQMDAVILTLIDAQKQQAVAMKELTAASTQLQMTVAGLVIKVENLHQRIGK